MLHLIATTVERALPAPLHRALLPIAHKVRHRWRIWRGVPIAGVSVAITNPKGELLLLRHSYGPKVWALPGGGLKPGEDPAECAKREVAEELGLELDAITALGTIEETLSGSPHTAHLFTGLASKTPAPDKREVVEARFFSTNALPEPLGEVTRRRIDAWRARSSA